MNRRVINRWALSRRRPLDEPLVLGSIDDFSGSPPRRSSLGANGATPSAWQCRPTHRREGRERHPHWTGLAVALARAPARGRAAGPCVECVLSLPDTNDGEAIGAQGRRCCVRSAVLALGLDLLEAWQSPLRKRSSLIAVPSASRSSSAKRSSSPSRAIPSNQSAVSATVTRASPRRALRARETAASEIPVDGERRGKPFGRPQAVGVCDLEIDHEPELPQKRWMIPSHRAALMELGLGARKRRRHRSSTGRSRYLPASSGRS